MRGGFQKTVDLYRQCTLEFQKFLLWQKVSESNHNSEQVTFTTLIQTAFFGNAEFRMKFHIRNRILGAIRKKPFIMRTNISELGHNCKKLTQLFFIYMSEIFAYLALQVEWKEKIHLGERAKRQSIHQNPKRNIVIGISLIGYVGVLRCQSQLLQFIRQSVNALLVFPHIVIVRFQKICALGFSVLLRKIIGKQRTDMSLNVQKIMKK